MLASRGCGGSLRGRGRRVQSWDRRGEGAGRTRVLPRVIHVDWAGTSGVGVTAVFRDCPIIITILVRRMETSEPPDCVFMLIDC